MSGITTVPAFAGSGLGATCNTGRLDRLFAASQFDAVEMVDIELETPRETEWVLGEFWDNDVEIIISFHEFNNTPELETLYAVFEDCARFGDIAKVATYAEDWSDSLRILETVNTATKNGMRVASISMGEVGGHIRVVTPLYGSTLGSASLESDRSEYALGRIPSRTLAFMLDTPEVMDADLIQFPCIDENESLAGLVKLEWTRAE